MFKKLVLAASLALLGSSASAFTYFTVVPLPAGPSVTPPVTPPAGPSVALDLVQQTQSMQPTMDAPEGGLSLMMGGINVCQDVVPAVLSLGLNPVIDGTVLDWSALNGRSVTVSLHRLDTWHDDAVNGHHLWFIRWTQANGWEMLAPKDADVSVTYTLNFTGDPMGDTVVPPPAEMGIADTFQTDGQVLICSTLGGGGRITGLWQFGYSVTPNDGGNASGTFLLHGAAF